MPSDLPTMTPVTSSNVESLGYQNGHMFVTFKGQKGKPPSTYRYRDVPQNVFDAVKGNKSVGRALADYVTHFYKGEKL